MWVWPLSVIVALPSVAVGGSVVGLSHHAVHLVHVMGGDRLPVEGVGRLGGREILKEELIG